MTVAIAIIVWPFAMTRCDGGVNYEEAPISYSKTTPVNPISRLQKQIDEASCGLAFEKPQGYLKSLLRALDIPESSQVLTFAKTSLQAGLISPSTPRAIYFNDQTHVGYVQDGLIEIAVADPALGMAFYTLEQLETEKPRFVQATNHCLTCHGAARTRNVPGLQIRSVYPDPKGQPVIAAGSVRTDHTTPMEKRWGGWYVTGRHGTQLHLGNFTLADDKKPKSIDNSSGQNLIDLSTRFDTSTYLTPHSDIVALMVLEHQADTLNLLTIANFEGRYADFVRNQRERSPDPAATQKVAETRIAKAGDALVRNLLFCGEAQLKDPVAGTGRFASEFAANTTRDNKGRSLRDFDLQTRLFKYPCSYLIYSDSFAALPLNVKTYVYMRLVSVLSSSDTTDDFSHLSLKDREAILGILLETKEDFASIQKRTAASERSP